MQHDPRDYDQDPDAAPINPLPWVIVVIALAIGGVEAAFQLGQAGLIGGPAATGWRLAALERFGFYQPQFQWMIDNHAFRWDYALRMLSYPFVHGRMVQAVFALVFILALGKAVGELFSWWSMLVLFFAATVVGALAYGLVWDTRVVLFGAFPPAYGFIGAYSFLLWVGLAGTGFGRLKAFYLIGFLMALQLAWGVAVGGSYDWVADLAGFATGFLLSFLVSPGGWHRVLDKLRQR